MEVVNHSPYYRLLGMEVKEMMKGESRIEMPFKSDLTHHFGIVHGGAIASLADAAVALALLSLVDPNDRIATIELKINYFVPIRQGKLTAKAKIIHKGSVTAVGDAEVFNEDGKLTAKAIATYHIKRKD